MRRRARRQIHEAAEKALARHGDDVLVEIWVHLTPQMRDEMGLAKDEVIGHVAGHRLQVKDHASGRDTYCVVTVFSRNKAAKTAVNEKFDIDTRPTAIDAMEEAINESA